MTMHFSVLIAAIPELWFATQWGARELLKCIRCNRENVMADFFVLTYLKANRCNFYICEIIGTPMLWIEITIGLTDF
jgi:hypothetical protein